MNNLFHTTPASSHGHLRDGRRVGLVARHTLGQQGKFYSKSLRRLTLLLSQILLEAIRFGPFGFHRAQKSIHIEKQSNLYITFIQKY